MLNHTKTMKEKIRNILEGALPLVDLDSQFLMAELDSLDVTTIMMLLADNFGIEVDATDATQANFKTLDTLAEMVRRKQNADA